MNIKHGLCYYLVLIILVNKANNSCNISANDLELNQKVSEVLPNFINQIKNLQIPEQVLSIEAYISTLSISISKITLDLIGFSSKQIVISKLIGNKIQALVKKSHAECNFVLDLEFGYLRESYKIFVKLKDIEGESAISVFFDNKCNNPYIGFDSLKLDLDLDFKVDSYILSTISYFAESMIKSKIKSVIIQEVKSLLLNKTNDIIKSYLSNQRTSARKQDL